MEALSKAAPKLTRLKVARPVKLVDKTNPGENQQKVIECDANPIKAARQKLITRGNKGQ